jgi:integrase
MITLRPWKGSKNTYEADINLTAPDGRQVRRRVKVPVTGKSAAERWARGREQVLLAELMGLSAAGPRERAAEAPERARAVAQRVEVPEAPAVPTVGEFAVTFIECCKADRLALNTLTGYDMHLRVYILPVLGSRRLDAISQRDLLALKARLIQLAVSTAAEILKTLKCLLNRAIKLGVLERAPLEVEVPRRLKRSPVAYTDAETTALLAEATEAGSEALAMVLLGLDGGLRRGEILALRWDDLDLERRAMTIRRTLVRGKVSDTTKGRSEETVGMTRRLTDALTAARHTRGRFVLAPRARRALHGEMDPRSAAPPGREGRRPLARHPRAPPHLRHPDRRQRRRHQRRRRPAPPPRPPDGRALYRPPRGRR